MPLSNRESILRGPGEDARDGEADGKRRFAAAAPALVDPFQPERARRSRPRSGRRWTLSDTPLAGAALLHEADHPPEFACSADILNVLFAADVAPERRLQILASRRLVLVDSFSGLPILVARVLGDRDPRALGEALLRDYPAEVEAFGLEYELTT